MTDGGQRLVLLKRAERAREARSDLLTFLKFTMPDPEDPDDYERSTYRPAPHHVAVTDAVQNFVEGTGEFAPDGPHAECSILILTMPPRHGKTRIVSMHLPAWLLGRRPRDSLIVAAYNDDFAADYGAEVRKIMQTTQYQQVFPGVHLIRGGTAKDRLQTTEGGLATFVGRGGSMTGRGGHIMVGDDLLKGADDARSKTIRDQIWDWFTKVFMTRRMGKKKVILTFTRWHADDPIGRLTDHNNVDFFNEELARSIKIINFPAFAEDDDPLGREPGEALWPEEHSASFLAQQRMLDPLGFSALYQQRPTVEDGVLFTRESLRYYDPEELPSNLRYYCASDHAVSEDQRRDATVLGKGGVDQHGRLYMTEVWWKRARTDMVAEAMLTMGTNATPPLIWWAEKGHISKSIGPFLKRMMLEEQRFVNIVEVTPAGDKEQRAQAISARMSLGMVYFPRNAWWTEKAVAELLGFPNGLHDDFVDMMSLFGLGLRVQTSAGAILKKNEPKYGTLGWLKKEQRRAESDQRRAEYGAF